MRYSSDRQRTLADAGTARVNVLGCQLRIRPDDGVQITKAMEIYHAVVGFSENSEATELQYAFRFEDGAGVGPVSRDAFFAVVLRYPGRSPFVGQLRSRNSVPEQQRIVYALFPLRFDAELRERVRRALLQAGLSGTAEESLIHFSLFSSTGYEIESVRMRRLP
jgi:hypothetical protein